MTTHARTRAVGAVVGSGAALTSLLVGGPAAGVTTGHGAGSCPRPSDLPTLITAEVSADAAVRAADARVVARAKATQRARARERTAVRTLRKARRTSLHRDDTVAMRRYRKAHRVRLAAQRAETAARVSAARARATARAAITKRHAANPCVESIAAPVGLQAVAGNDTVALSWTAVANVTAYHVYRDGLLVGWTGTTGWIDTTAHNGTAYSYTVRALDSAFESPDSMGVVAMPVLPAPMELQASAEPGAVVLEWLPVAHATGYRVLRGGVTIGTATTTTYTDSAVTGGISYEYTVVSTEGTATSAASNVASATPPVLAPAAPTGLAATVGDGMLTLHWNAVATATGYTVFRGGTQVGTATTTTYLDSGLANGTRYAYTVRATNSAGSSPESATTNATPLPPAPAAPTGLTATPGNAQVTLSWSATAGATGYRVYRNGSFLATTTMPSYTATGLTNSTTYSFTVRATNLGGNSSSSSAVTATPVNATATVPSAPTSLVATPGNAQVGLTWTPVAGATDYQVLRGGVQIGTTTAAAYNDSSAANGTTYTYTVTASNTAGTSPASSPVSATPNAPAPSAPTGLVATPGNAQVSLTWTPVAGATSYQVLRGGAQIGTTTTATYTDTTAANGTTYSYTVRAVGTGGTSPASSPVSATPNAPAPSAPTGLVATPGNAQVSLTWTPVAGATSYQVLRGGAQIGTTTTATYTDTTAANGTTYSYTVRAVGTGGTSPDSAAASATPNAPAPSAPTGLVATPGNAQVSLTWTPVAGATSYQVLRGGAQIGTTTTATYTDTTAANGTTYSYTVRAVGTGGTSPASSPVSATPNAPAPSAPTGLVATPGNAQVSLTWTPVAGATSYQVLRGGAQIGTTTTATYTDTTAANGTTYSYTVRAVGTGGTSPDSAAASATPAAALPAPTGLAAGSATNLSTGAMRISWTSVAGATGYQVFRDGTLLGTSTTTTYTPADPLLGTSHVYTVRATSTASTSPSSAALTAGAYQGASVNDVLGRTIYGQIQVTVVITTAATKSATGCWATYPTNSDSGPINLKAIPFLCSEVLTKQPTSATVATLITSRITSVTQASATPPAFKTSLQGALTQAGM